MTQILLSPDRYFSPDPSQRQAAAQLFAQVEHLPLVCPHGHVDPRMFADPDYTFGSPTELLIIPDHYIFRMLYSQGIALEELGIPRKDGGASESDQRKIWQIFAENLHLFHGTPTGSWFKEEMVSIFDIPEKLTAQNAQAIYDQLQSRLASPEFRPRRMFERFNIEVLCTTDAAGDSLAAHQAIRASQWQGRVLPTFRPDAVVNLDSADWLNHLHNLEQAAGISIHSYAGFIQALEKRRAFFKSLGARATDHAALTAYTAELSPLQAEAIFQNALRAQLQPEDVARFTAHMLIEMARMSTEDGLVMQLHVGSLRNHSTDIFTRFGADKGADIPVTCEFSHNLRPLLQRFGAHPGLTLVLFTLDESSYSRELAPLAGVYPALRLGPPWWFFDSLNGMRRYFDLVMETAGIYNSAGFNDDTRAFPSIPARHKMWRRAACDWVAGLLLRGIVDEEEAHSMAHSLAYGQARRVYGL